MCESVMPGIAYFILCENPAQPDIDKSEIIQVIEYLHVDSVSSMALTDICMLCDVFDEDTYIK